MRRAQASRLRFVAASSTVFSSFFLVLDLSDACILEPEAMILWGAISRPHLGSSSQSRRCSREAGWVSRSRSSALQASFENVVWEVSRY